MSRIYNSLFDEGGGYDTAMQLAAHYAEPNCPDCGGKGVLPDGSICECAERNALLDELLPE